MAVSSMPKYQFIYSLICLTLFTLTAQAQPPRWATLYQEQKIQELFQAYQKGEIQEPDWQLFVRALQTTAGDSAVRMMAQIFSHTSDARLKAFIQERVYQYYYAGGYYKTATKIRENAAYILELFPLQNEGEKKYGIQIGAFRSRENALKLMQSWQNTFLDMEIVQIIRNGVRLYVVVVGKFATRDEALHFRETLNKKWHLRGYIFQY